MSQPRQYTAEFVDSFPPTMAPGILYISAKYSTAGHLCPCGCRCEVVTKLSPARWRIVFDGEVSLRPSVAAAGLPCNSHYFISRGEVEWDESLSASQMARAREADRRALDEHRAPTVRSWAERFWRRLRQ